MHLQCTEEDSKACDQLILFNILNNFSLQIYHHWGWRLSQLLKCNFFSVLKKLSHCNETRTRNLVMICCNLDTTHKYKVKNIKWSDLNSRLCVSIQQPTAERGPGCARCIQTVILMCGVSADYCSNRITDWI